MEEHARNDRPGGDPETTQPIVREAVSGSARAQGLATDSPITETRVLARVPVLDTTEEGPHGPPSRSDGRILSQGLSTKILLAAGVCIALVAVGSWTLDWGKSDSSEDGSKWQMEAPAPGAPEAPLFGGDESAPGFVQSAASTSPVPEMNFQPRVPELPAWADAPRTDPLSTQTAPMGEGRAAVDTTPGTATPRAWDAPQSAPTWQPPTDIPRVSDRTPNWNRGSSSPPADSEPVSSAWPNPARLPASTAPAGFGSPATTAMSSPSPTVNAAPVYGSRYDSQTTGASYYRAYRDPQVDSTGQAVPSQRVATVPAEYRNPYVSDRPTTYSPESQVQPPTWTARPVEPGMARLEGTIAKPTFRTTDDRARSSVY